MNHKQQITTQKEVTHCKATLVRAVFYGIAPQTHGRAVTLPTHRCALTLADLAAFVGSCQLHSCPPLLAAMIA